MLIPLNRAKTLLGIPLDNDPAEDLLLTAAISAATSAIENYLNRKLEYGTYRQTLDAPGTPFLRLRNYPVHTVNSLEHRGMTVAAGSYDIEPDNGMLFRRDGWGCGERIIAVEYVAGYILPSETPGAPDSTLPPNMEYACALLAQTLMRQPGVTAERVGDLSVNYKDDGGDLPGVVKALLMR
ncbi:phage head-tail connector protein [Paenibacillus campi]|uniref:phage head-tail connector protein n=1 Tax=Paenibacillus campi TaxID=3106031 RepID=UPI002AFF60DB|nr:phage head-tail connector protein [Paenibacillus sp. SGZ-1014]